MQLVQDHGFPALFGLAWNKDSKKQGLDIFVGLRNKKELDRPKPLLHNLKLTVLSAKKGTQSKKGSMILHSKDKKIKYSVENDEVNYDKKPAESAQKGWRIGGKSGKSYVEGWVLPTDAAGKHFIKVGFRLKPMMGVQQCVGSDRIDPKYQDDDWDEDCWGGFFGFELGERARLS